MAEEAWPFACEDGRVTFEAELGVNDVWFFTVKNAVGGKL